jgi:hypothetical protein
VTGQPAMKVSSVTREQFERWMTELSNWGRWGKDDDRGALLELRVAVDFDAKPA